MRIHTFFALVMLSAVCWIGLITIVRAVLP
jgi:hypothetical protein